jgi:hypothetical protein
MFLYLHNVMSSHVQSHTFTNDAYGRSYALEFSMHNIYSLSNLLILSFFWCIRELYIWTFYMIRVYTVVCAPKMGVPAPLISESSIQL